MASAAALQTSVYQGDRKHGRMEGHGKYTFPSGCVYTGQFLDGEFHGEGVLEYPGGCGKYHATWNRGKVVTGRYVFADGLEYTSPADGEWSYCRPDGDRRFFPASMECAQGSHTTGTRSSKVASGPSKGYYPLVQAGLSVYQGAR